MSDLELTPLATASLSVTGSCTSSRLRGPETLLLASGARSSFFPTDWKSEAVGERILDRLERQPRARRAVTDALPLLVAAQSVTVLVVDPEASDRQAWSPAPTSRCFLARHGVHVEVERRSSTGTSVAEAILCCAAERHADLIVIGAYSRPAPPRSCSAA